VSMHATSSNHVHNFMRFKYMMGTILVFALIDNGITHNFINLTLLNEKKLSSSLYKSHDSNCG
jgi:hypothetical protein